MAKITKWEYMHYSDGHNIDKLNEFGQLGWEMVGFGHNPYSTPPESNDDVPIPDKCTFCFFFKREIN